MYLVTMINDLIVCFNFFTIKIVNLTEKISNSPGHLRLSIFKYSKILRSIYNKP